ncbi:MAG TPA: GNAT family N-acetyltransferase [Anaerolineales bacterium]|nr:GNAT family N-acetyltransferase [Anaerolineales bacterium]
MGSWNLYPLGVYEEGRPVGIILYGLNYADPDMQELIMRLMVDEKFQGQGYGRFAMQAVLDIFRADENVKAVVISYLLENVGAKNLYASLGFVETGEVFHGELVAVLKMEA